MSASEDRVQQALERAGEAFWTAFAREFPEVTTGDLDPLSTVAFDDAVERAARAWLDANWPSAANAPLSA
jgi:hypothetical protein